MKLITRGCIRLMICIYGIFDQPRRKVVSILRWEIPANQYGRWGLYSQALIVLSVWAVMELRPTFTGHPVSTGYAIAALALAAVVMAARGDALTTTEKIVWIAICAVLFMWELNVIDKEHDAQEIQHTADMGLQATQFNDTLDEFTKANKTITDDFKTTIQTLVYSHREDERSFAGVLRRQGKAFKSLTELSEQFSGRLVPGDSPTPPNACIAAGTNPDNGEILTILGNDATIGKFPVIVSMVGAARELIGVHKIPQSDEAYLSLDFRDEQNRVLLRMNEDGVVNRSRLILLHPGKDTFLLQDEYGAEFLRVTYVNPTVFQVTGSEIYCGKVRPIQPGGLINMCLKGAPDVDMYTFAPPCPTPQK